MHLSWAIFLYKHSGAVTGDRYVCWLVMPVMGMTKLSKVLNAIYLSVWMLTVMRMTKLSKVLNAIYLSVWMLTVLPFPISAKYRIWDSSVSSGHQKSRLAFFTLSNTWILISLLQIKAFILIFCPPPFRTIMCTAIMEPRGSIPHSHGLSNSSYHKVNQSNSLYWHLFI